MTALVTTAGGSIDLQQLIGIVLLAVERGDLAYIQLPDGSTVPVSPTASMRLRYNNGTKAAELSVDGGAYSALITAMGGNGYTPGGNAFGQNSTLGLTDNFTLGLIANGVTFATLDPNAGGPGVAGLNIPVSATFNSIDASGSITALAAMSGRTLSSTFGNITSAADVVAVGNVNGASLASTATDVTSARDLVATRDVTAGRNASITTKATVGTTPTVAPLTTDLVDVGSAGALADVAGVVVELLQSSGNAGSADIQCVRAIGLSSGTASGSRIIGSQMFSVWGSTAAPDSGGLVAYGANFGAHPLVVAALGTVPNAYGFASQFDAVGFGPTSSHFTNVYNFYAYATTTDVTHTVTNLWGVYIANQGHAGVTNAVGLEIAAQSGASGTNVGIKNGGTLVQSGNAGFFGAATVGRQNVTGALSLVVDANAKAVLTSIINALVNLGLISNGTT